MFEVRVSEKATKQLNDIPDHFQDEVRRFLKELEVYPNTRHLRLKKLTNEPGYRGRIGNYRIVFEIDGKNHILRVTRIRDRKEAYR